MKFKVTPALAIAVGAVLLAAGFSFLSRQSRAPQEYAALRVPQRSGEPENSVEPAHAPLPGEIPAAELPSARKSEEASAAAAQSEAPAGNLAAIPGLPAGVESSKNSSPDAAPAQTVSARQNWDVSGTADRGNKARPGTGGRLSRMETGRGAYAAGGEAEAEFAAASARTNALVSATLASAGITRGPDGLIISKAISSRLKPNEPLFQPGVVAALGGRLGQGAVSMDTGSAATPANFNPKAAGLGSNPGKTEPGPEIKAGKAPAIPAGHIGYMLQAARAAGIDPALLAATAARESNFRREAYRAEPHLKQVSWRASPGQPPKSYFDGSIGPTQVLRSNFKAQGIDNDTQAFDLANNYLVGARIIRGNLQYFPGNSWKAVAAYNVGKRGVELGYVPKNNYTNTILSWRVEYQRALAAYQNSR